MAAQPPSDPERSSTPEPCSAAKRVRLYGGDSDSDSEVVHDMKMGITTTTITILATTTIIILATTTILGITTPTILGIQLKLGDHLFYSIFNDLLNQGQVNLSDCESDFDDDSVFGTVSSDDGDDNCNYFGDTYYNFIPVLEEQYQQSKLEFEQQKEFNEHNLNDPCTTALFEKHNLYSYDVPSAQQLCGTHTELSDACESYLTQIPDGSGQNSTIQDTPGLTGYGNCDTYKIIDELILHLQKIMVNLVVVAM